MFSITTRAGAVMLAAALMNVAAAQDYYAPGPAAGGVQQVQAMSYPPSYPPQVSAAGAVSGGQYPQLNAPLYPSPVQYTPPWNGGTVITNQAFAPHEMLYPHTYHAMYPPFYYKVKGGWIVTPCGVKQHEHWKLQGTEVNVKYRSHYPLFGGYHPPRIH